MCSTYSHPSAGCIGCIMRWHVAHTHMSYFASSCLDSPAGEDDLSDQLLCAFRICCELLGKL